MHEGLINGSNLETRVYTRHSYPVVEQEGYVSPVLMTLKPAKKQHPGYACLKFFPVQMGMASVDEQASV